MEPLTVCSINPDQEISDSPLRFVVEEIIPHPDENRSAAHGYIASGSMKVGGSVLSSITGKQSILEVITEFEESVGTIGLGAKATVSLLGDAGIRVGDVLTTPDMPCEFFSDQRAGIS
jgi:sulfate adenylyltransferase subunit 1 (EFTu-like GTPase family)